MSRVTVLGASGGLGQAISSELVARGHDVTGVSRNGDIRIAGLKSRSADLHNAEDAISACSGAEIVVMAAGLPYRQWARRFPSMVDNVIAAAAAADARLIMVDNLYAYGCPKGPISTHTTEAATTEKGAVRREIARRLRHANDTGRCRVAIGRVSDYYGPGGTNTPVYVLGVQRALAGKRPKALIHGAQPHTFHYLPDAARGFARLIESAAADGQTWIVPAAPPITQDDLMTLIATQAGAPTPRGRVSPAMLAVAGLAHPDLRQLSELICQWDRPYTIDTTAFGNALGTIKTTPHEQAVAETLDAFRDTKSTGMRRRKAPPR